MENDLPRTTWRLILSGPQPGKMNMALDAAILEAVERGTSLPTLRLYNWSPPCLSLGYSQPFSDIDPNRLRAYGWDVVRRPTGGRAILHADELTYSVIGPKTDPRLRGGLMDSYRRISRALFQALRYLGLPVEVHTGKNPLARHQPVCFENPSDYEITVNGKKIIGSAQARRKKSILQHGSLPLTGDLTRIIKALAYPSEEERSRAGEILLEKADTVSGILGQEVSWDTAARAFQEAFSDVLQLDLSEGPFTPEEIESARNLAENQFGAPDWTRGAHIKPNR
ncbi:MAG TPA: lipoate--protein ligase family protein [Chloroflexi bacterium]|nr:lipoate--protein ligase family protein [Chloroflexota bacterium]